MQRPRTLLYVLSLFLGTLIISSCSKQQDPVETLESFVAHLRSGDFEAAAALTTGPNVLEGVDADFDINDRDFLQALTQHLTYEVLSKDIEGPNSALTLRVTNANVPTIMNELLSLGNMMTYLLLGDAAEDKMMGDLLNSIRSDNAPTRTETVEARFVLVDGTWLFDLDLGASEAEVAPVLNAFTGYVTDFSL